MLSLTGSLLPEPFSIPAFPNAALSNTNPLVTSTKPAKKSKSAAVDVPDELPLAEDIEEEEQVTEGEDEMSLRRAERKKAKKVEKEKRKRDEEAAAPVEEQPPKSKKKKTAA